MAHSGATLVLASFKAPCQEQHEDKLVYGVVKNIPFAADFTMEGNFNHYEVDFHRFKLKCVLLFDCEEEEREVNCVRSVPVIWTTQVNETGERATLNIRLMVLSSQREDFLFRIKFIATPPSHLPYLPLVVLSAPIRVVSKQQQLRPLGTAPAVKKSRKRPREKTNSPPSITNVAKQPTRAKRSKVTKEDTAAEEFVAHLQGMIEAFSRIPLENKHQLKDHLKGDCTDMLFQLNSIADTLLKCTADIYSQQLPEDDSILMQAPLQEENQGGVSVEGSCVIPNLDDMDFSGVVAAAESNAPVFANPDDLFCSWDLEEKKAEFESEAIEPTPNCTTTTTTTTSTSNMQVPQAYAPNPLSESQAAFDKVGDFGFEAECQGLQPLSEIPNLDLLYPTEQHYDAMGFFQPYTLHSTHQ